MYHYEVLKCQCWRALHTQRRGEVAPRRKGVESLAQVDHREAAAKRIKRGAALEEEALPCVPCCASTRIKRDNIGFRHTLVAQ